MLFPAPEFAKGPDIDEGARRCPLWVKFIAYRDALLQETPGRPLDLCTYLACQWQYAKGT